MQGGRRAFKATLEYDGTDFSGFQFQPECRTVQGVLEAAVLRITGQELRVTGAGRTDAGVHALGQTVGFRVETGIPVERMAPALNANLPVDVRVTTVAEVDETFHARFSAQSRRYVYLLLNRAAPSALLGRYAWHIPGQLAVGQMQDALDRLIGEHDFAAWANDVREVRSSVRRMLVCKVRRQGPLVLVCVEANAFLKGMVRNIVGTLVQVGCGQRAPGDFEAITRSCDRGEAGPSAPARGLCLVRVRY